MKKKKLENKWKGNSGYLFLLLFILVIANVRAEGSRDLYPAQAQGGRAHLRASLVTNSYYPFSTLGEHYVYAEEGEVIALASNAQSNAEQKRIFLYAPDGTEVTPVATSNLEGYIPNRQAELAGPRLPGESNGNNKYRALHYTVPTGGSGVYRVNFLGTSGRTNGGTRLYYSVADAWPPTYNNFSDYLIAWDITVAKQVYGNWNWQLGRVFTKVLNLDNPSGTDDDTMRPGSGFFGVFKILTRDGYVYNVDNNGNHGMSFTFMVNNQGFHKVGDPTTPSYESINAESESLVKDRYHDPRTDDNGTVVTQKIFYNLPDNAMPERAKSEMDGGQTWLRVKEKSLNITDLRIEGAEGASNQVGNKGAFIRFYNESGGAYDIRIKPKPGAYFPERHIEGTSVIGENEIFWDGKDGNGDFIPVGKADVEVDLKLHGAEVHFPYIDMELNQNGIIIELLSTDLQSVISDKIYWDDTGIGNGGGSFGSKSEPRNASHTIYPDGISSRVNGHIWGQNSQGIAYSYETFGDEQGIDTWTFIKGEVVSTNFDVEVVEADLEVVSVQTSQTHLVSNDEVTYIVQVKNNGPSDVKGTIFTFDVPVGLIPMQALFSSTVGVLQTVPIAFDVNKSRYQAVLDMDNGGEGTYELTLKAINPNAGTLVVEAALLRPKDVIDPDATNVIHDVPPTDATFECVNNGLGLPCNNIKQNTQVLYSNAAISFYKEGRFNDENGDGWAQIGETITYVLELKNTGDVALKDIVLQDPLLGGIIVEQPIKSNNSDSFLDVGETWTYTLTYVVTTLDLKKEGVYNQANISAIDTLTQGTLNVRSKPKQVLTPGQPGYDVNLIDHTFVELKTNKVLISNPMIYQRVK
ncbi:MULTISPECIES: DUF7507 domain-containing protein [unclassified Myroides]|uniref:DUF7507 domain-containing protein n=1 Tax=unclassified Myroides TaxID=2642485 RepID=UPI003D2F879F